MTCSPAPSTTAAHAGEGWCSGCMALSGTRSLLTWTMAGRTLQVPGKQIENRTGAQRPQAGAGRAAARSHTPRGSTLRRRR